MSPETIFDKMADPLTSTGGSAGEGAPDPSEIRERIFGTRSKSSKRKASRAPIEDATQKELEEIFAGENWEEVAALYFNSRFAITGWDGFQLTNPQRKTLGLSLATSMKMLLKIDPGYIALIVFTANFGSLIAQKEVIYSKLLKDEERKNAKASA